MKIIMILWLVFFAGFLQAQTKPSAYVDKKGILRWSADNSEVNEFGVNYTLPFAYAYRACQHLNISPEKAIDEDVYHLSRLGLTAFRVHVWDTEISDTFGNLLDNEHLQLFDYTLKKMEDRGFKFILTPIAFWNGIPEKGKQLPGFAHKYGKNNCYSNPEAIKAQENYLYQFMNHVNRYTGTAYKDDPNIIAFEISNEPEHRTETAEETTAYINKLVEAIRRSGCQKPLFYCMSVAPRLLNAFLDANIQGGSVQWYSLGLLRGHNRHGNFLTNIDQWPKDTITGSVKAKNKALMAYELDAADNGYAYTYPVMAREFRKERVQFATQFAYDPLALADANTSYQTHYMNLAYAPQKALSLMIAGEVFHRVPMGKSYGTYPADTVFDAFRVSYVDDLAEMRTDEKFLYANTTTDKPLSSAKLKKIVGYGSSPVVQYNGRGAYFLDKLEDGIWRLEVMPDATWVKDPFAVPSLDREVSAIVWNTYPMTIDLPDLGSGYSLKGINNGNSVIQTAYGGKISVSPGTYLLTKKGIDSKWKPTDKWKNITLNEFVAPPATTNSYLLHQPTPEITKGSSHNIDVEVVSAKEPERVQLYLITAAPRRLKPIEFEQISRYGYTAKIPADLLKNEGILNYQVVVDEDNQSKIYPEGVSVNPDNRFFQSPEMYTMQIVDSAAPICLLDVAVDKERMIKPHRRFDFIFRPSTIPGKLGLVMDAGNMSYTSFFFSDEVAGRRADMTAKQRLTLRGTALSDIPVKLWVSLQLRDGSEWGDTVSLSNNQKQYELPLSHFRRIKITGPGEKGPVYIETYPSGHGSENDFDVRKAETIKITVARSGNTAQKPQAAVEYVMLE